VEHFKAAAVAADSKNMDAVLKYCAVGRQLGYAGYLTLDTITFVGVNRIWRCLSMLANLSGWLA
jgi:peroxin-11B